MPKYKFNCDFCNRQWWEWMGMKDPLPEECPHCEQGKPFKVPTSFVTIKKTIQESTKIGEAGNSTIYEFKHEGKTYIIVSKSYNDGGVAIIEHNKTQEGEL